VGELKGTNFGISAASYPDLDIRNLTQQDADAIYRRDYWLPSGADHLPWPANLLVMDSAILHGVGAAKKWVNEVGTDPLAIAAKRLRVYTHGDNWQHFGAGWVNRIAALLDESTKG
jgi:lysozyme family protein